jgi:hypothetical protein
MHLPTTLTPAALDAIFPYICFAYGAFMTITLNVPTLVRIADERLPQHLANQWKAHRVFGAICLGVGALWILQNLWVAH